MRLDTSSLDTSSVDTSSVDTSSLDTSSLPRLVIHDVSYLLITQNQNYMYDYYFKF